MKVRMFEGFYDVAEKGSDSDYYLAPVAFPMREQAPPPYEEVLITNEQELREWADVAFVDYNIWTMEVPAGAIVEEE